MIGEQKMVTREPMTSLYMPSQPPLFSSQAKTYGLCKWFGICLQTCYNSLTASSNKSSPSAHVGRWTDGRT